MRLFRCQCCGMVLYFESTVCVGCGHELGYLPERFELSALVPAGEGWTPLAGGPGERRFRCRNATRNACNWLVPPGTNDALCLSCRYTRTTPPSWDHEAMAGWRDIELAKRHLFYSLTRFGLPLVTREDDPEHGLAFDVLQELWAPDGTLEPVLTGHRGGLITINVAEADDAEREKRRAAMGESYRTLLGHMRHEIAHYFWDRLVRDSPDVLRRCRTVFGDERTDYRAALDAHYVNGPPDGWQHRFVSGYAAAHPWEDFAETWAHLFHIVDTLETAHALGITLAPAILDGRPVAAHVALDPYHSGGIDELIRAWVPLTLAVNSLNRSMGQPDLYPFVLEGPVIAKLGFVRDLIASGSVAPA